MPSINDSQCPVCGGTKKVKIKVHPPDLATPSFVEFELFGYTLADNEELLECYCGKCGLQFHYPYQ